MCVRDLKWLCGLGQDITDFTFPAQQRGDKTANVMIKVHRKSPSRTKLSSLYVFDAICRHAAQIVRKGASGFDYRHAEAPCGSQTERGTKQALTDSASSFIRSASDFLMEMVTSTLEAVREDQRVRATRGRAGEGQCQTNLLIWPSTSTAYRQRCSRLSTSGLRQALSTKRC